MIKIVLNRITACQKGSFFVTLQYQSRTIMYDGIKYSMRDPLSDVNNYS